MVVIYFATLKSRSNNEGLQNFTFNYHLKTDMMEWRVVAPTVICGEIAMCGALLKLVAQIVLMLYLNNLINNAVSFNNVPKKAF
jgi:hypothetical protein